MGSTLDRSDYLDQLAASDGRVIWTALIEFTWAAAASALGLVAAVYSGYTQDFGFSTLQTALYAPIGLQEMVMAVWLLAKGFNPSSVDGEADALNRRNDLRKGAVP